MKLRLSSSILFALIAPAFANHNSTELATINHPGKIYISIFGGDASPNNVNSSQYGTAFFPEFAGGPLAVNAFGQLQGQSAAFFGGQLGYQARDIPLNLNSCSKWLLGPAAELEGYAMRKSTFSGDMINNTTRIPEHDFVTSYPMNRTLFFANVVLNVKNTSWLIHPYIGFGIGDAIIRISGANAKQVLPAEAGINHYNSNTSDATSAFAGQIKLGLSFDINTHLSLFAEYRRLYIANTHFVFGSTVYPTHVETSSWQVNLDSQKYNLGNAGIRFSI